MVKEILGSMLFKVLWNVEIAVFLMIEKLSSTKRFYVLGFVGVV